MYQATIFTDSPCLQACRKLLAKQRLAWEEEQITLSTEAAKVATGRWGVDRLVEGRENQPAIRVIVHCTKTLLPRTRNVKRAIKQVSGVLCEAVGDRFIWTMPSGSTVKASFAFDEKQYAKIRAESKARIDRQLTDDFKPALKGAL